MSVIRSRAGRNETCTTHTAYRTLSSIVPTLVVKNSDATTGQDVQRMIGEATGRSSQAEQVIAGTEALVAGQAERLQPYLANQVVVAVAYFRFDQFFVNGQDAPIGRLLAACGLDVISPGTAAAGEIDVLSLEQINAVADADIIIAPDFLPDQTAAQEVNAFFRALRRCSKATTCCSRRRWRRRRVSSRRSARSGVFLAWTP